MTIPKIIHYCWFGNKEIPELEKRCIESWGRTLPDYQIMFWNEETFNINSVTYVQQAYKEKKYAFVSDYVRIYALQKYGGIYLDTDVEVLKSFDKFLDNDMFIGFENRTMVGTGIIGSRANTSILKEILDYYHNNNFIDENKNLDTTTNVQIIGKIIRDKGFVSENKEQDLGSIHIYERDYFCPKKLGQGSFDITDRTISVHYFSGSWLSEKEKRRGNSKIWRNFCRPILKKVRISLIYILGERNTKKIENNLRSKIR